MVKKTFFKECFRAIRGSFSRFLAIFLIVALGAGFLAGLLATTPDMRHTVSEFFHDTNFYDLRIAGNLGLEQADLEAVAQAEGVRAVMAARSADREIALSTGDTVVGRFHGVTAWESDSDAVMNRPVLSEGRWPQRENECVVMLDGDLTAQALAIGQTFSLLPPEPDEDEEDAPEDPFLVQQYEIVGIVTSPYYLSMIQRGSTTMGNGTLGAVVYVNDSVLDMDYYTDLYVVVEGGQQAEAFTDGYDALIAPIRQRVEDLAETQKHVRADRLIGDAQAELDDAKQELADKTAEGEQELADALADLTEGEQEYADGLVELADGKKELEEAFWDLQQGEKDLVEGYQELLDAEQEYADGLIELEDGQREIDENLQKLEDAYAEIQDAKRELKKAFSQLESGEAELEAGRAQLDAAQKELDAGQAQLDAGREQLNAGQAQLDAGKAELEKQESQLELGHQFGMVSDEEYAAAKQQIEAGKQTLQQNQAYLDQQENYLNSQQAVINAAQKEIDEGRASLSSGARELGKGWTDYESALKEVEDADVERRNGLYLLQLAQEELDEGRQELADARIELDDAWLDYEQGKQDLKDGWAEYYDGQKELADAEIELADGRKELDDGWIEYQDGKKEFEEKIADANLKIRDAQDQIDDIEDPEWYVMTRDESNEGYIFYESDTEKVSAVAQVFPIFFYLVAALVASTTMTRMIDEDRGAIGTLKALGYSNAAIAGKYLLYAALACVLGSVVGLSVFLPLFPRIIVIPYENMYIVPDILPADHLRFIVVSSGGILVAILLTTLGALKGSLQDNAAVLMRPKAPPAGKRILLEHIRPLWRRMKFTHKVTARNLFRYKKRFFMTVIGIAGCTALLVAGFGLQDSIGDIAGIQFTQLQNYDMTISLKHEGDQHLDRRIAAALSDGSTVADILPVHMENGEGRSPDRNTDLYIVVPSDSARFTDYHTLRTRVGHETVPFTETGAVLTEKAADVLGIQPGGTLTLRSQDDEEAVIPVSGICENYVQGYVYLSPALYEQAFGEAPTFDTLLVKTAALDGGARDELAAALLESSNVTGVSFSATTIQTFEDMLSSIGYIVILLIVAAAALSFIVLYNLTNINICERQKEIATLKVLGFYRREVSGYVFRETAILSLFGTGLGLVIGMFFHRFVVLTAETDAAMFGRTVYPASYGYAAVLSLVFTFLVSLALKGKLRQIDMVESLKAPE
ncbi:MAG: ABC transporter permease [Clostridia bacterium]|nr:ABC transporter permease [Clostridia bacterium]